MTPLLFAIPYILLLSLPAHSAEVDLPVTVTLVLIEPSSGEAEEDNVEVIEEDGVKVEVVNYE